MGGLNFNWCMTEKQANATYRGFNVRRPAIELKSPWQRSAPAFTSCEFDLSLEQYPHQIVVWYALYRAARTTAGCDSSTGGNGILSGRQTLRYGLDGHGSATWTARWPVRRRARYWKRQRRRKKRV